MTLVSSGVSEMARRLIDADKLKQHNAWWATSCNEELREYKVIFDQIVDAQPTVAEVEDDEND